MQQHRWLKATEQDELIILTAEGGEVARHPLAPGSRVRVITPAHYAGLPGGPPVTSTLGAMHLPPPPPALDRLDGPVVEIRPLSDYERLLTEVLP